MKTGDLSLGHTNRSLGESISVGGKGINVSLVLAEFGIKSTALGFVGGFTGDQLVKMLDCDSIITDFVRVVGGNTRINVKLIGKEMTEINALGPNISEKEVLVLLEKTDAITDGDTVVIAGSVSKNLPSDIYEKILERLVERNIRIVIDATGELLLKTLKYKPFLIKPNVDELGDIFNTRIDCECDIVRYALELKKMGAVNVLVSMGKDGAVLVDENGEVLKRKAVSITAVNPVGAGDSMVAGFIAGADIDYRTALDYGIAAGGATACSEGLADKETIDKLLWQIDLDK